MENNKAKIEDCYVIVDVRCLEGLDIEVIRANQIATLEEVFEAGSDAGFIDAGGAVEDKETFYTIGDFLKYKESERDENK